MTKDEVRGRLKSGKRFLFITATEIETETLLEKFQPLDMADGLLMIPSGKRSYTVGKFGKHEAVHVQCDDMGTTAAGGASFTAMAAIGEWQPDAVIMVGIAFGKGSTGAADRGCSFFKIGHQLREGEVQRQKSGRAFS